MNGYTKMCLAFKADVSEALDKKILNNNDCRTNHRFYPKQMLKSGDPQIIMLYKFCAITNQCPNERWVFYNKETIDPYLLIQSIARTHNINVIFA
jgi:hypothetical protein